MQYRFEKVPFREIGVCDMLLIKNAEVYAPASIGKKDILICNEKIELIEDKIEGLPGNCRVMDGEGLPAYTCDRRRGGRKLPYPHPGTCPV